MTRSTAAAALFEQARQAVDDAVRLSHLREAVALARNDGDSDVELRSAIVLSSVAYRVGDAELLFSSFPRALALLDGNPDLGVATPAATRRLLWQYKWIVVAMAGTAAIPMSQLDAATADMRLRYVRAGAGPSGWLHCRAEAMVLTGRLGEAEQLYAESAISPRDTWSDCLACVTSAELQLRVALGDAAAAQRLFERVQADRIACTSEPGSAAAAMLGLASTSPGSVPKYEPAAVTLAASLPVRPPSLVGVADHIRFDLVRGRPHEALRRFEAWLPLLPRTTLRDDAAVRFLAAGAAALDRATEAGAGDTRLAGADTAEIRTVLGPGVRTVEDAASACWTLADAKADRLDARNGNDWYGEFVLRCRRLS